MVQKMMFRTKDNCIAVMDMPYIDGVQLSTKTREYEIYFSQHNYNDFISSMSGSYAADFDKKNSEFVNQQVHGFSYYKQPEKYKNRFNDEAYCGFSAAGMASLFADVDYNVKDDEVPQEIKELGFEITPNDVEWEVYLDGDTYKMRNSQKKDEEFTNTRASINSKRRKINVWRHHFKMDATTEQRMNELIADFKSSGKDINSYTASLPRQDKSLFKIYKNEVIMNKSLKLTLCHEYKHFKNTMFTDTVYYNRTKKRVTAKGAALLVEHEECAPRVGELINDINEYMKRGEWDNFDNFQSVDSAWLVYELQAMPVAERKDFLKNPANFVTRASQNWKIGNRDWYEKNQFGRHTENGTPYQGGVLDFIDKTPMNLPEETEDFGETYQRIRKLYYHFALYNPDTGKYEQRYLDKYIDPSLDELSDYAKNNIVSEAEARLQKRKNEYDAALNAGADASLIEQARQFMRQRKASMQYLYPENMYIESLDANYIAQHGISCENAGWSNYLQSYYQRQSNYTEIAKNDEEYVFKLGEDVVRYTDKSTLSVSKKAQFATYMQVLKEPSKKNTTINFMPNLTAEQALMLYAACVACGRKMKGNVPTDLSGLNRLQGIPPQTIDLINHRLGRTPTTSTPTPTASYYRSSSRGSYGGR